MSKLNPESLKAKKAKTDAFIEGSKDHSAGLDPSGVAKKSFTLPMNEYELDLLRRCAVKNGRSMRQEARRLLARVLADELE